MLEEARNKEVGRGHETLTLDPYRSYGRIQRVTSCPSKDTHAHEVPNLQPALAQVHLETCFCTSSSINSASVSGPLRSQSGRSAAMNSW
ncbi:hypothetical protein E2C01_001293 [Portunus trituberculatus]|uniref:Uncharacterized protein n=1 Tax=Portunus trituberculatus TaxID=210409 RepID=A0A5B7CGY1_PORTR|nr:hypothetical protein [Portunus trituberculatus]